MERRRTVGWTAALIGAVACVISGKAIAMEECIIEPWRIIRLGARTTGVLDSIRVDRGQMVKAGDLVASLNSEIERASLELAKTRADSTAALDLAKARAEYEDANLRRSETLFERKVASAQQMDEVRATHRIAHLQVAQSESDRVLAQLEYQRAKAVVELKSITSPVDGIVVSTDRTIGEFLGEGDHVATIAMINPLRAEAFLSIDMLPFVAVGAKVKVFPELDEMGELAGVVDVVDRVVDARSGSFGVRIRLENPQMRTLAGMRCMVDFAIDRREATGN